MPECSVRLDKFHLADRGLLPPNGETRSSAVIDTKPPIQEPSAANSTYAQFDV
jgi:hypothetical protein